MKKIFITIILILTLQSQENMILNILDQQVHAFNSRDLARLTENISDNFTWYSISSDSLIKEVYGKEHFKKSMDRYFKSIPYLKSSIQSYTIHKNKISFKEVVHYRTKKGKEAISTALGVYEIRDKKSSVPGTL